MQRDRVSKVIVLVILLALSFAVRAQQPAQQFTPPEDLDFRKANVISEGVRLTAELYSPKSAAGKQLPTIIMSHGWGGTVANLRREALDLRMPDIWLSRSIIGAGAQVIREWS